MYPKSDPLIHMSHPPNGILIGSAVVAQLSRVTNTQTDTQTTLRYVRRL